MESVTSGMIDILHVDDEEPLLELTKLQLENHNETISVISETNPNEAIKLAENQSFDCIVSDYNMPEMNGIDFLQQIREEFPDLPFILFTGRGSEEIASDAISAGVTDYLQKETGSDQYAVLANRIENAVSQYRAERQIEQTQEYFSTILEHSSDFVMIVDEMGDISYISPSVERVMGYTPEDLEGVNAFEFTHPEDMEKAASAMEAVVAEPMSEHTVEFRAQDNEGEWMWLEVRGRNLYDEPVIDGVMVNARDITERKEREQDLERRTARLEDLTQFLSHDLNNQIMFINGQLDLARKEYEGEHLDAAQRGVERIEQMVEKAGLLAEDQEKALNMRPLEVSEVVERCWANIEHSGASLRIEGDLTVIADLEQLKRLVDNLFWNAIDHVGEDVTITAGILDGRNGFFVEDDGPGIDAEVREQIFDSNYTTTESGTGFGLAIVEQIAENHGWSVTVTESNDGGARFEIMGVEQASD